MHGPRTVNADGKGVVVKPVENKQTVTLHTAKPLTETRSASGS